MGDQQLEDGREDDEHLHGELLQCVNFARYEKLCRHMQDLLEGLGLESFAKMRDEGVNLY